MSWFKWFKKKPLVEPAPAVEIPPVQVSEFTKHTHKAYFETLLTQEPGGNWVAEVRFIGYIDPDLRHTHTLVSNTREGAQQLADKLIRESMANYKK